MREDLSALRRVTTLTTLQRLVGTQTSGVHLQDMTALSYLNEPGVLWNLNCRYMLDAIYTYTGSILIAVNPFASLPHMYGSHMMEQYRGRDLGELSPHVYAIADAAYRQMRKDAKSQSILVGRLFSPARLLACILLLITVHSCHAAKGRGEEVPVQPFR